MSGAREGWRGWDDYAAFYDWENAQTVQRRDVAFWQRLAAAADGPVLELGSGTGRITVPIARDGTRVVGIERSGPMLLRAASKLRRARATRHALLIRGDIRHLPFRRGTFPLVMAPYGILQSLTREADLAATLASVSRVMPKGARFGIDLVPDLVRWEEYSGKKTLSGKMGRHTSISLVESVRQDRAKRLTIFDQQYVTVRDGDRRRHHFTLTFRTLSIRQMSSRLERAGFRVDAVLGDYQGGPWDARADAWVILAAKR